MLAADKLQLQSSLKQKATALKEKEFNLHHSNLMTVGTQAAVLAGLDVTMFIEFQPLHDNEWSTVYYVPRILKFLYYVSIVAAFCANITVVSQTTLLSLLSSSLSLRGPDGSMITATDNLYEERKIVFKAFGMGLACTVLSVIIAVWLILSPEAALVCSSISIFTGFHMYTQYMRVCKIFTFDESQTVTFNDIFYGPGNINVSTDTHARQIAHDNVVHHNNHQQHQYDNNFSSHSTTDFQQFKLVNGACQQQHQPENTGRRKLMQPRGDAFLSGRASPNKQLMTV